MFTSGPNLAGSAGEDMSAAKWQWLPAMYVAGLLLMNIFSIPLGHSEMPDKCPEGSHNCDYRTIALDVGEEELHDAMEEWAHDRSFTTTFSPGHIAVSYTHLTLPTILLV